MINTISETSIELWQRDNLCYLQSRFILMYFSLLSATKEGGKINDEVKMDKG